MLATALGKCGGSGKRGVETVNNVNLGWIRLLNLLCRQTLFSASFSVIVINFVFTLLQSELPPSRSGPEPTYSCEMKTSHLVTVLQIVLKHSLTDKHMTRLSASGHLFSEV